jgi:hypothetical protein
MRVNGVDPKLWPTLEHGDIESPELKEIASFVSNLTDAGVLVPDETLERRMRELAGLPKPDEE